MGTWKIISQYHGLMLWEKGTRYGGSSLQVRNGVRITHQGHGDSQYRDKDSPLHPHHPLDMKVLLDSLSHIIQCLKFYDGIMCVWEQMMAGMPFSICITGSKFNIEYQGTSMMFCPLSIQFYCSCDELLKSHPLYGVIQANILIIMKPLHLWLVLQ